MVGSHILNTLAANTQQPRTTRQIKKNFPNIVYGLSDHTTSNLACLGAVALGASIIERHYTDNMDRIGPDIVCSMDEKNCKELIENSRIIKSMLGGTKEPAKEEKVTIDFAFSTVVSIKDISKGENFSEDNIWVKRPGTGEIKAEFYKKVLGKVSGKSIKKGMHIKWSDCM